jgi:hypothetical protein
LGLIDSYPCSLIAPKSLLGTLDSLNRRFRLQFSHIVLRLHLGDYFVGRVVARLQGIVGQSQLEHR